LKEIGLFGNYLGIENEEENLKQLENLFQIFQKNARELTSIYIGGNHFLHLDYSIIIEKIKKFNFNKLNKLDGQFID